MESGDKQEDENIDGSGSGTVLMRSYAIRQILDGDPYLKQDNQLRNRNSLMFWK